MIKFPSFDRPRYTIRQQFVWLSIVIGILILLAGSIVVWQVNQLASAVNDLRVARELATSALGVRQDSTHLIATVNRLLPVEHSDLFEAGVTDSLEELQESYANLATLTADVVEDEPAYHLLHRVNGRVDSFIGIVETMIRQARAEQWPSVQVRVGVLVRDQQQLVNDTGKLVDIIRAMEEAASIQVVSVQRATVLVTALFVILAVALGALLVWWTTRAITRPITILTEAATAIAEGDLSQAVTVETHNEISLLAQAFNAMTERLRDSIDTLEDRVQERTQALETSAAISQQLTAILNLDELLRHVVNRIQTEYDFYHTHIYLAEEETECLTMAEGTGEVGRQLKEEGHQWQKGQGIVGTVARTNEHILINSVKEAPDFVETPLLPDTNSELAVPLRKGKQVLGVLDIHSERINRFTPADISLVQSIANQTAAAIENARLYEQAQKEIAERVRAEEALRHREEYFRSLIENASDLILILDGAGVIRYASPSFERTLGYKAEDLVGQDSFDYVHPDDAPKATDTIAQATQGSDLPSLIEIRIRNEDHSYRVMEINVSVLVDDSSEARIVINARDITERKRAEEILTEYTSRLERSNRELEEFAYIASHDLQEPLRKVTTFSDRLRTKYDRVLDEQGRDYLTRMQVAATRMQALIGGLLTYSRVTTKAQPFGRVDLTRVAHEVTADLEIRIEQVNGQVEIGDLPTIDADPIQMRQLLQNLIGNALKFHQEDEPPAVRIYAKAPARQGTSSNGLCQILVRDNGIGFEEKHLDRIFQVFQRLHGRGHYEGTGIGLATCRKIVERHGGNITAQSSPGQGATFIVSLPTRQLQGEERL
jgi:PAS domain S-box-containing protein